MNSEEIKEIISQFKFSTEAKEFGRVISVFDGIVIASGLQDVTMEELVIFKETQIKGVVLSMDEDTVNILVLGDFEDIKMGDEIQRTETYFNLPVSDEMIGRIFDGFGNPIDNQPPIISNEFLEVEGEAVPMIDRSEVVNQLVTGVKTIDCLTPIGKGQRQLILGDMSTGKTSIGLTTMISQKDESDVVSIYVSVGQQIGNCQRMLSYLKKYNVKNFIMIVANCSDSAAMRYYAPLIGCTIGEYFRNKGKHAVIIYDNLNAHAIAHREISLILKKTPGREAFSGDVFYIHAKLLERASQLNKRNGGGSLTALPICETFSGDISAYISTNIISITDGQLFLSHEEFVKNFRPAVKSGISVSRIGGACQYPILRKLVGSLKIELAQYEEFVEFTKFSTNITPEIQKILDKGDLIKKFLQQGLLPTPMWEQILILFGFKHNLFNNESSFELFINKIQTLETYSRKILKFTEEDLIKIVGEINV